MDARKLGKGAAAAAFGGLFASIRGFTAAAQDDVVDGPDVAAAGNGGTATASANGGAVSVGDVNSGGNVGSAIAVGDTKGAVAIDGGTVSSSTNLTISANGGTAIADASGGDNNFAFVS